VGTVGFHPLVNFSPTKRLEAPCLTSLGTWPRCP